MLANGSMIAKGVVNCLTQNQAIVVYIAVMELFLAPLFRKEKTVATDIQAAN